MNEELKVIVVTHKDFDDTKLPKCYQVVQVGSDDHLQTLHPNWQRDNTGINISSENAYYCELTAQYWEWKNSTIKSKYVGLVHYRRYFFDYHDKSTSYDQDIITDRQIEEILQKKDAILSFPTAKYAGYGTLYNNKSKEEQDINWVTIEKIIHDVYPEYVDSFNRVLYGKLATWGNMLITKRHLFEQYSAWLFDVLDRYDVQMEAEGHKRIPRVDGFLSEYLLLVWFHKNLPSNKIKYLEVRNTETDTFNDYSQSFSGKVVHHIRSHYSLLFLARWARICVLMLKRRS
ncbi:DUF4422 domain-containing protein [Lacticaseibacillus sp. N501-2]|uniref:DUF4422 domain-containing protein n=1 Tax=Lacticaseibacillus salsurae TaxID=3367729 RepID=UPI0038B3BF85